MASVKAGVSFTCPNCAKVLRASARPPAGKKIKCPACSEAFVPELDEEEEKKTRIQAKPNTKLKAKASPSKSADDDDRPRAKRPRDDEDDEDDRPKKKRGRDDDDDEDDDADLRLKKKKAKKKSGGMMMAVIGVFLLGGFGLLSCGLCGVGAYVWPGFMLSKNAEMIAFVAPDANLLIGAKPKELKSKFAPFKDMFGQIAGGPNAADRFPEMEDALMNSDGMLIFMKTSEFAMVGMNRAGPKVVVIAKVEAADVDRLKKSNKLDPARTVDGFEIRNVRVKPGVEREQVVFTGGLMIVSNLDENQFVATLKRGTKEPAKSAAIDLSRSVDKSPMWMAMTFDGESRRKLREGFDEAGKLSAGMKAAAPAADGAKGMTITVDVTPANDIKLALSMMCKNADDAGKVKKGAEEGWNTAKAGLDQAQQQLGAMMPFMNSLIKDLNSTAFTTQGESAIATVTFSNATIQEVAKAAKNNPFMAVAGGPGFGPPPVQAPPFNPKDIPQGPKTMIVFNLPAGQVKEEVYNFQQGQKLRIVVAAITAGKGVRPNADFTILQGPVGENVLFTENNNGQPQRTVNWTVPATGQYRVRVRNNGPNNLGNGTVTIWEK